MLTLFSNRVYKKILPTADVFAIGEEIVKFNSAKHHLVKRITHSKRTGKSFLIKGQSLHMYVKGTFGYNDYFANSVINVAEAAIASHREAHQLNIQSLQNRIATKEKKIKQLRQHLKGKLAMLESCIRISKASKQAKPRKKDLKLKTYRGCREKQLPYGYVVCHRKYCRVYYNLYDFEYTYLHPAIKNIKNRISMITHSVNLLKDKLSRLETHPPGITFGTKKLFRAQFTKYTGLCPGVQRRRHNLWLDKWRHHRNKSLKIIGRGDGKYGNFVFKYDTGTRELKVQLQYKTIILSNIIFPYGQNLLDEVLEDRTLKRPLTWEVEDRGDYYIFKVMFEPPPIDRNYYTGDGVISYDTNYDHIAWTELDNKGRLIQHGRIPLPLDGKTTGQATKIIEAAAIGLVSIAREAKKPLVGEKLDTGNSQSRLAYGNKKRNYKLTRFAYAKIQQSIESRAHKEGVGVIYKNPAYTSVTGKIKYMRMLGVSIHTAAALVIGRRGMGFKEKVPKLYRNIIPEKNRCRHHWSHWRFLHRHLKQFKVHSFYNVSLTGTPFENVKACKAMINAA